MSETLTELFRHNAWANDRLFAACEDLSEAQVDATLTGTFGSIRDTLAHIAGLQDRVVTTVTEAGPVAVSRERLPLPGVTALRDAIRESSDALVDLAGRAESGATVTTNDRGAEFTLPVWLLLLQAIVHASEHRTQVAAVRTQLGIESPGMDGWTYHETCFDGDWSKLWSA